MYINSLERLSFGQKVINGQNPLKRVWKNEAFDENCLDLSNKFKRLLYRRTDDSLLPDKSIQIHCLASARNFVYFLIFRTHCIPLPDVR